MTDISHQAAATVVITTRNRKEELRGALRSALSQRASLEILVIDDGSTDGTSAMVRDEFPSVRLDRSEQSLGLIVQRNRGAELASGPIIVSIDDDAIFSTPNTVAQTLAEFDDPRIGAVAIPFTNVNQDQVVQQRAPDAERIWVARCYIGTAHAIRRELFLELNGYRAFLFHQGEEGDFCVRMLDAGYHTRLGRADPIHHFESPRRDFRRMDLYGRRNDVLYAWYNVPFPYLPFRLLATTIHGILFGIRVRRPWRMMLGLLKGYAAIPGQWSTRRPVRRETHRLSRLLGRRRMAPIEEVSLGSTPQGASR